MNSKGSLRNFEALVIVGPTGSGKTEVAIKIAKMLDGEIISADSRAIYKGMDIGTAKPTAKEQAEVPHFGIDLVEPDERFTAADFKHYALQKIREIQSRGHKPIVVGGTGLYIDALIYDYQFDEQGYSESNRAHRKDNTEKVGRKVCTKYLLIGIEADPEVLRQRLASRIDKMFVQSLFDEVERLASKYDWSLQAMKSNVYWWAWQYLQKKISLDEAKQKSFYRDWHLAKRQMTWFKHTPEINWMKFEKVCSFVLKYK